MKVHYDKEADALYLKLGDESPEGVIEIAEGVNLDTTSQRQDSGPRDPGCFQEDRSENNIVLNPGIGQGFDKSGKCSAMNSFTCRA